MSCWPEQTARASPASPADSSWSTLTTIGPKIPVRTSPQATSWGSSPDVYEMAAAASSRPQAPVVGISAATWNRTRAPLVIEPKIPSTGPALKPWSLRNLCNFRTSTLRVDPVCSEASVMSSICNDPLNASSDDQVPLSGKPTEA